VILHEEAATHGIPVAPSLVGDEEFD
jgi:hypothetical protein